MNITLVLGLSLALAGHAADTRFWQQYDPADYEKATLKQLALRSDGRLTLAPVFKELHDTSTPYLWAVASDSKGNLYAGGGAPGAAAAKLFHVDPAGKARTLAELPGLEVHAIAIDRQDRVYAATSPDGKVYRVDGNGKADVFYDPKAKYIWAMAFGPAGDLYVATGDKGEIHKVNAAGQGAVFFQSDETHARSMVIDKQGNLIIGTEPAGLVLRVNAKGEGFVLHQSSKREVTAVAVAADGVVYAAAVGNKAPATAPPPPQIPIAAPVAAPAAAAARPQPVPPPTIAPAPSIGGGSELIRIDTDGAPRRIWSHSTDLVYSIGLDARQRPVLGTGNRGRIYRVDSPQLFTTLVSSTSTQITALAPGLNGALYAVTANIGKIFRLGPETEKEGTLESDVLDSGAFSYWGRARWEGDAAGGQITLETRSGNLDRPQKNWSAWSAVPLTKDSGRMASPAARFLQYRLKLSAGTGTGTPSPSVTMVELAYLSKNVAPVVQAVESTPANYRFPASSSAVSSGTPATINLPAIGQRSRSGGGLSLDSASSTLNHAKGWIGARWSANDENGDTLVFKLEIRGQGESEWKLLKDQLRDRHYSWDSTAFADGNYQVRVTASDAPGNPPNDALTAQLESEPFLVDNTAPQIANLTAAMENGKLTVRWQARDKASVIERAEYSLNGGEWTVAQPVSRLADSLTLDYVLSLSRPSAGEVTVAVRITDEFENQTVDKATVK
ncbi:MAG: hypothetical protein JNK87_41150 [Bryobacterales bacterium]|nr:hypothetical protein [Bryobacterales bacterium]